jgi:hypothetical protein
MLDTSAFDEATEDRTPDKSQGKIEAATRRELLVNQTSISRPADYEVAKWRNIK